MAFREQGQDSGRAPVVPNGSRRHNKEKVAPRRDVVPDAHRQVDDGSFCIVGHIARDSKLLL